MRDWAWRPLVPVIVVAAGLLFGISAETARGTDLRGTRLNLSQLIQDQEAAVAGSEAERAALERAVDRLEHIIAAGDAGVAEAQDAGDALAAAVGLTAVHGPGVQVVLDDAPLPADGTLPPGARPDDVVIHQSDVQAVVNAMWAAGADAVAIMDQRIIATSAVRCVGNTLLLQGRTYSPPFRISAIGDESRIRQALSDSPGVELFLQAVDYFDLGYDVNGSDDVSIPAYDGPLGIDVATPPN